MAKVYGGAGGGGGGKSGYGISQGIDWLRTHTLTGAEIKDPKPDVDLFGASKKYKYKPDSRRGDDYKTGKRSFVREVWDELKGETVGGQPIRTVESAVPEAIKPTKPKGPVKRAKTTTTVVPTKRPETPQAATKSSGFRGVQSWRGGDVPQQVRYDPGTKPNPTKKQRARAGGVHDTKGLKWFK